jgi:hypothetical protein
MQEELTPMQLKGFNSGYELAKHEPELFNKLLSSLERNNDTEYIQGLKFGKGQADRENLLEQLKQSQERNRPKEKDRD